MPPGAGSPALGAGVADAAPAYDQRGVARAGPIDIGAVQVAHSYVVTVAGDDRHAAGAGFSVRDAIALADGSPDAPNTVTFDGSLADQELDLTRAGDRTSGPSALGVEGDVILDGTSPGGITLARPANAPAFRLFEVHPGASLTLKGLTLSGGLARGEPGGMPSRTTPAGAVRGSAAPCSTAGTWSFRALPSPAIRPRGAGGGAN